MGIMKMVGEKIEKERLFGIFHFRNESRDKIKMVWPCRK